MNSLLAALPRKDYLRMVKHLKPVELDYGEILYEPGELLLEENDAHLLLQRFFHRILFVEGRLVLFRPMCNVHLFHHVR